MKACIYCRQEKDDADFSLEHVIPQCLGGALMPAEFKTRDVCKTCNNNLGQFVDASFEKSWFVSQQLSDNARALFDPSSPKGLPLKCMGPCDFKVPGMLETEVCESWLGPFGEQIYWVRPCDENFYWYNGGNPRTTKSVESRAYFMFSINSNKDALLTWLSFKESFSGRRIRKVMCTQVEGANPREIGFTQPDQLDIERIGFFLSKCESGSDVHIRLSMNTKFDVRFMAKLAIGMAHCLYEKPLLSEAYLDELHKALWLKPGDEDPLVNGTPTLGGELDPQFANFIAMEGAIVLLIKGAPNNSSLIVSLSPRLISTIKFAEHLGSLVPLQDRAIIIYKDIGQCIQMPMHEFVAFKLGRYLHPELQEISDRIRRSREYFSSLRG